MASADMASADRASADRASDDIPGAGSPGTVLVRYFAAARAAAGVDSEPIPAGLSVDELVSELVAQRGERLGAVLGVASFLIDGVTCHDRRIPLAAGVTVDVLPPFAGG